MVDRERGVVVAAPMRASRQEIGAFVERHAGWIARRLAALASAPPPLQFVTGEAIPYLGEPAPLVVEAGSSRWVRVAMSDGVLRLGVPTRLGDEERGEATRRALVRWYQERAAERLAADVDRWAEVIGVEPKGVRVRDQRRRWGSCGVDGMLRFNWRLVMAPPAIIDYVVVHELCHLRVLNHSAAFWAEVARFMPDYAERRAQLNALGPTLSF